MQVVSCSHYFCLLGSCDDKLEVQQAYNFSLTSWYLSENHLPDETVEIRLTLNRSGNYEEARYQIGYIQMEGSGEVYDKKNVRLVNREMQTVGFDCGVGRQRSLSAGIHTLLS